MAFQQLITKKIKLNGLMGIQHHLLDRDRVKTNPDIDLSRTHLNYFIENLTAENLNSRVKARIKQLNLKKRPRSDAVGLEDIVVKASQDFMLNAEAETREQYFADGRLSAKYLFSPKTLEQLQTDFHRNVSSHYGLERGEPHAKKYLPVQKFKAQQAKLKAEKFTQNLQTIDINQQKIEQVNQSVHYATTGIIFTSEDKETVQLPTSNFLALRHFAEQGIKAVAKIDIFKDDIKQRQHDEAQARSDLSFFLHELSKLEKDTEKYSAVPKFRRKHIDDSIDFWKKQFANYCHDLNRNIVKVFIATHGDFNKTFQIMHRLIKNTGVKNIEKHIAETIRSAKLQLKNHSQPIACQPSWKPPKLSETDYQKSDVTPLVSAQVVKLGGDDINWRC